MKNKISIKITIALIITFVLNGLEVYGQTAEPGSFSVNQKVEVEYIPGSGKWLPATIVEILNDGYSYKVSVAPDGKETQTNIHFRRVRPSVFLPKESFDDNKNETVLAGLVYGKYGCTAAKYRNGAHEYTPRGSFVITSDGNYAYYGFEKPSKGKFTTDEKGLIYFKNGYLDGGEATPLGKGYENRFYLVFPTIPDNRWTCGLIEE